MKRKGQKKRNRERVRQKLRERERLNCEREGGRFVPLAVSGHFQNSSNTKVSANIIVLSPEKK